MTTENDNLDFEKAKDMTVEEAVKKSEELKAGITEDDSILDKYIKQNREQVEAQKFENTDIDSLDTASLDNFIKKQREELAASGLLENASDDVKEVAEEVISGASTESAKADLEETIVAETALIPETESSQAAAETNNVKEETESESASILLGDAEDTPVYKNKKVIFGSLAAIIVAIFAVAFGLNALNSSNQTASSSSSSSASSSSSSSSSTSDAKANNDAFTTLYDSFYTDSNKTALKNSSFSSLSDLEAALEKLKDTDYYDAAKKKYDALKSQIEAIQTVNGLFEAEAIVDGTYNSSVAVKAGANFDSLPSSVLNTGNATTDSLIQTAIAGGRSLQAGTATTTAAASSQADQASQAASDTTTAATSSAASASTGSATTTTTPSVSAATSYGITSYDVSTLQRDKSRVPYNDAAIADSSNSAWTFGEGVLEKIVATSQARGYITGNNYILERVNIINGNGYYNMFKPDGTYLFSINAKTGYFVGNAAGNSDALDY
ncbi:cell division site-positioning protein MapZ family protein [Streptococcus loxodontisalivarius]|uniref:Mid-cell-anchored protein Z n=1 Tax=Streptococcus loxodontisalivarius TaxID=1349415 RepID=A0ABS2PQG9_9STRE|nr:cell division site-positioning protein MapZ family protein [Streptococcus loxodontisalivarius]MBM7642230.1 hypothetical protein [Streptococcus loxodontisalivarius]